MLIEKETLDSIMTKDKGKLPLLSLLPFNTLHLTEPCSSAFTTIPNHSKYGLTRQVLSPRKLSLHVDAGKRINARIKG